MPVFFKNCITKRSLLGTLLLTILIGEPTVGIATGIFTPPGIIIFFFLYLTLFHVFDSIIAKYHLVTYQVILLTFAFYAVFVTGFLNKELTEYVLQPNPVITLIRIQASFFVAFAFYLLNKIVPRDKTKTLTIHQSLTFFAVYVLLMSLTGMWGIPSIIKTFTLVPVLSIAFSIAALAAIFVAFMGKPKPTVYNNKKLLFVIYFYLLMGAIPNLLTFMVLLITMILGGIFLLFNKTARHHPL